MEKIPSAIKPMMLSHQINQVYYAHQGYDTFDNLRSYDAHSLFGSYLHLQKNIASCLTYQNVQVSL